MLQQSLAATSMTICKLKTSTVGVLMAAAVAQARSERSGWGHGTLNPKTPKCPTPPVRGGAGATASKKERRGKGSLDMEM
ncbi:hypothetical protein B0H65DRAFT_549988 [Neurospora tetraspora]|uniref:Uncharacterized protein n=1 Tax=Neurospora tetraspora TaxID=94610 RepID=A0AAE0MQI9_9PEZI|nr:hypothetical protein B0H65DRAFT_549988 [Neurospora tetraspora]